MSAETAEIKQIFTDQVLTAKEMYTDAKSAVGDAYKMFTDPSIFKYQPYEWELARPPFLIFPPFPPAPPAPGTVALPGRPGMVGYPAISNPDYGTAPEFTGQPPTPSYPPKPGPEPNDNTGSPPAKVTLSFPQKPGNAGSLLALPSTALPYPTLNIPPPPSLTDVVFDGTIPDDIHQISFDEYMQKLTEAYDKYSKDIPALVFGNWMLWFKSYLGERPLIDKLVHAVSLYMDTGGAGIPVPIEEAIITRATDRVTAEQRRATKNVYDAAVKRGLLLPSGTLVAGLKEARQVSAEAVSKVATDVAIENLKLEHAHMQFMLKLGSELEQWIASFASDVCKNVLGANAQAIEMTKFILTGMIEINNIMVKIYLAKWEAYKAAVEVFKAKIQAQEMVIRLYEAEIKAEMAKAEIDKAWVEMVNAVANVNRAIADVYKTEMEAEAIKIEAYRADVMGYEALVHAYVARVEAWKARWQGYTAEMEGEVAKAKVYEANVNAYTARVGAFKARVDAYSSKVHADAEHITAIGRQNEESLKGWSIEVEGRMKQFVANTEAYKARWGAISEQVRGTAENSRIAADTLFKGYEIEARVDTERAREHLSEWTAALQAHLHAADGVVQSSRISAELTAAALNSLVAFSGQMTTFQGASG